MFRRTARLALAFNLLLLTAAGSAQAFEWKQVVPARAHKSHKAHQQHEARIAQSALESGVFDQLNALRRQHGLTSLRLSVRLCAAARQHSSEMAARGYFSHSSANGSSFDKRLARYYPVSRRYWSVGENLLWSSPDVDPAGAVRLWFNSPEHRANMLTSRWREVGISAVHVHSAPGTFGGREVTVVTADFGVRR
jgi:uncharacterized protein YkwD